jgi:CRISPR/Cas system CSM-associated protein Csm5 (group 7 of RAMP superfamily)
VLSGSLDMDQENNAIFKCISRFDKKVIIPGSTMKGMVRTIAECISHSCMLINDSKKTLRRMYCMQNFGYLGYKRKVRFSDLINQDENYKTRIVNVPQLF